MMRTIFCFVLTGVSLLNGQAPSGPKTFATPEEARDALFQAAAIGLDAVRDMFGPGSAEIVRTGDEVMDKRLLDDFNRRVKEKSRFVSDEMNSNRATLLIGEIEWPFAVPLMRRNGRWYFDVQEGKAEIHRRIIGGNELDAIEICNGYVTAQYTYAEVDRDRNGLLEYARRIVSSPGKKDGLFWSGGDSPISEGFAKAVAEGYVPRNGPPKVYHGYFYKILTGQGANAEGGAHDYLVNNLMIGGFALIAWPAEYGVSGITTFIVNQDGLVYEKDLGPETARLASATTLFNPDKTWNIVIQLPSEGDGETN